MSYELNVRIRRDGTRYNLFQLLDELICIQNASKLPSFEGTTPIPLLPSHKSCDSRSLYRDAVTLYKTALDANDIRPFGLQELEEGLRLVESGNVQLYLM